MTFLVHSRSKAPFFSVLKHVFLTAILLLAASPSVFGAGANLSWDANTEPDLSGYKVYMGTSSGSYGSPTSVGNATSYAASGLSAGTYFFAVTAIDTSGNESGFSSEVSKTISTTDSTPPVVSSIAATSITSIAATISWSTNEASDTQVQYGTSTAYGSTTGLNSTLTTSHTQGLSGLTPATLYNYRVLSRDAAGNLTTSANNTFTSASVVDITAPSISSMATSNLSTSGATVSWTTNEAASAQVEYGTSSAYGATSALDSSLGTAHSITLSGLSANTLYNYRVLSRDAAGNLATSGNSTFTTLDVPDTTSPVLSGIIASGLTATGAIITWSTDEGASSQVDYGTTSAYGLSTAKSTALVTSHSQTLSGLSAATSYHYQVRSSDAADNESVSSNGTFTTPASTGLVISNLNVVSGRSYQIVNNGLANETLAYIDRSYTIGGVPTALNGASYIKTANDDKNATGSPFLTFDVTEGVDIYIAHDDRISTPSWLSSFVDTGDNLIVDGKTLSLLKKTFSAGTISLGDNGASSNSRKMYVVIVDGAGSAPTDTTAPVFSNAAAGNITSIGAVITWNTDEAASSQVEYGSTTIYGSLSAKNTTLVTSHSRSLSGLLASTTYHYRLISIDAAGNQALGVNRSFTTASADLDGPTLSSVSAGGISETTAAITWISDEPASAQVEYGTTSAYGSSSSLNETLLLSHSVSLSGLEAGTTYNYRVLSRDAGGNLTVSGNQTFQTTVVSTTPPDTSAPADVGSFAASGSDGSIRLSWVNPSDSDFVGVRIRFRTDQFPTDINDGTLLGDIGGDPDQSMSLDHTSLINGTTYFYLAASYDGSGNFQTTIFVSATPTAATIVAAGQEETSGGGGGCGIIRPGGGNPPGPGDSAAMLTLIAFIALALLKKMSKTGAARYFAKMA